MVRALLHALVVAGAVVCESSVVLLRSSLVVAFALLVVGTVLVFEAFDRGSHSASDTLRPFLLTMVPVWAIAVGAAAVLLRDRPR